MDLQAEGNVPATKCSSVIKIVAKQLFDTDFNDRDLPCLQSAVNIADEAHVVAKIQATERLLQSENFTLHADGTSRGGRKIVGHQVTLDSGEHLSLGIMSVACEDAATLLDVTVSLLQEIKDLYCGWKNATEEGEEVFKQLLARLTSIMTDRAATMKKFDVKLLEFLKSTLGTQTSLHFLHCNAHFLLGLCRSCESSCKIMEEKEGKKLGRDALPKFQLYKKTETATVRVIRLTCDIVGPRGDDKNGCRAEWLAFCDEHRLKSHMTSYRSNRFNCFFQSAAAIIHHLQDLRSFLTEGYLSHSNNKIESVAADVQDDTLLSYVCAIALLYIQVTGPIWNLLDSKVKYFDFHRYVQKMETYILQWQEDSSDLLNPDFPGMFGGEFKLTSDLREATFKYAAEHPQVQSALEFIMQNLLIVTRLQLADFLEGGKYSEAQSPDVQTVLRHCPLTNLIGENVFGEMDFDMNKRRHASFFHRTSLQIARFNKTSAWLDNKTKEEQKEVMREGRKQGHPLRLQYRRQEQLVKLRIRERLLENKRKKAEKEAKTAERRKDLIRRVLAHGGPCQRQEDIDKLIRRHKRAGASTARIKMHLKDEVRFQKTVVNKKGSLKLTGSLEDLRVALQRHLLTVTERPIPSTDRPVASSSATSFHPGGDISDAEMNEDTVEAAPFQFTRQGQWVAVYFVERYDIGQVLEVKENGSQASVQYLEQVRGHKDCFRWPSREDIVESTHAEDVFLWDFDCLPVSNDGRIWRVDDVEEIAAAYARVSSIYFE